MFQSRMTTSRRTLLGGLAALTLAAVTAPAQAGVESEASRFIEQLAHDTVAVVADRDTDPGERGAKLRDLLVRGFDTEVISRFVLGRYWRDASEAQQREFVALFRDYTVASYARRFETYAGHSLRVIEARDQGGETGKVKVLVSSQLLRPNGGPVKVDWRVRQTADGWRIYDVVVEGVSMVLTQRSEFSAVIQRGGGNIQGLLDQLRDRTAQLEAAYNARSAS